MARPPGTSVRLRLTLSYAAVVLLAGVGLIAVVWVFLLRYVPERAIVLPVERVPGAGSRTPGGSLFIPGQSDLWEAFAPKAALLLGLLLVLGLVGGWFLAGRVLAPVQQIAAATRRAGSGSLSHRIELPGRRDEFRELADAFDTMLARLEAHVAEQRRFAANASHELRTPLTITQTLLDVARQDPDRITGELVQQLAAVNGRAIDLTEALLVLSRAEQRSFAREPVDLSLAAEEASETLLPLVETRGIALELSGGPAEVLGSPALLQLMTTNLVHNAIVHNLPERGTIRLSTTTEPDAAVLTVENTGAALPSRLLPTLTEAFQRGTERVRTDHAGVGLGLAIVQSIVQAHDGTLTLSGREAGGLRVRVRLPLAPG